MTCQDFPRVTLWASGRALYMWRLSYAPPVSSDGKPRYKVAASGRQLHHHLHNVVACYTYTYEPYKKGSRSLVTLRRLVLVPRKNVIEPHIKLTRQIFLLAWNFILKMNYWIKRHIYRSNMFVVTLNCVLNIYPTYNVILCVNCIIISFCFLKGSLILS